MAARKVVKQERTQVSEKSYTYVCHFEIGRRVEIDAQPDMHGIVTGVMFAQNGSIQIEVSWIHNGDVKSACLAEARIRSLI